jgi:gamma-glutamyl-gamma-aminobutyraldehyde dehydrogenase
VFADCENLDAAADMAAFGTFFNQGEVCSANSRLYVERSIKDAFVEKLTEIAKAMQPGDPLDPASKMGAIVDRKQTEGVMKYVEAGKQTARLVAGGEQIKIDGKGCFVQPTIFDDVSHGDALRATRFLVRCYLLFHSIQKKLLFVWPTIVSMVLRLRSGLTI